MACLCKNQTDQPTDYQTLPDQPCLFCGEKHFATAFALAEEFGYVPVNRQRIIGELVCACWHIYQEQMPLAEKLRDLRHDIQLRKKISRDQWNGIAAEFDKILESKGKEKNIDAKDNHVPEG